MGADLIVDAVAVHEFYKGPVIVIDYGTATTFELVLEDGTLSAVVICPGIRISVNAMGDGTAKLPEIEIKSLNPYTCQRDNFPSPGRHFLWKYRSDRVYR